MEYATDIVKAHKRDAVELFRAGCDDEVSLTKNPEPDFDSLTKSYLTQDKLRAAAHAVQRSASRSFASEMRIRCAAGCKATPTYGTGSLGTEGELTSLPGQRYLVVDVQPGGHNHPQGVFIDVIMLPPDPGFVAQLKGQTLAKSLRSNSQWDKKKTVIVYRREPSRTRQAQPVLAILM